MGLFENIAKSAQNISNDIGKGIAGTVESVGGAIEDTGNVVNQGIENVATVFSAPFKLIDTIINLDSSDLMMKNPKMDAFMAALNLSRGYKLPGKSVRILRISDISFHETSQKYDNTLSVQDALKNNANTVLDTTTYPDRAILRLYNGRGFSAWVTSITIDAIRTMQYSGEAGELIHDSLKRDDDIRRNGETVFEIGNEYIVDGTQCAKIADYWYKALGKKKHMYALSIPGSCPWYSVGDWYNLQVGEADTNEYIDAVVECFSVDIERSAGGIGSTNLILRDVEDNWAKTTLYETRLATGGSPKRRVNRSNIVTVASSEYDGTYDYKCDGTDDDVQIQAAIDYASNTWGGGEIQLTNGSFVLGATIYLRTNIVLRGVGASTVLYGHPYDGLPNIHLNAITGSVLKELTIDGTNAGGGASFAVVLCSDAGIVGPNLIYKVTIQGYTCPSGSVTSLLYNNGASRNTHVINCTLQSMIATAGNTSVLGMGRFAMVTNNVLGTYTGYGTGTGTGLLNCAKCQQNSVVGASTNKYDSSYADSGTNNECDDDANGGFNS